MMRSLYAGVSGLKAHQTKMDVIGNNIANVNTVGFKKSRVTFQEMLNQNIRGASAPTDSRGGTNPIQIGLGAKVGGIDVIHSDGSPQTTGRTLDMAIEGEGYFILSENDSKKLYTRAGNFEFDKNNTLANPNGLKVQGYLADPKTLQINYNSIQPIDLNKLVKASAGQTSLVSLGKNLDALSEIEPKLENVPTFAMTEVGNPSDTEPFVMEFGPIYQDEIVLEEFDPGTGQPTGNFLKLEHNDDKYNSVNYDYKFDRVTGRLEIYDVGLLQREGFTQGNSVNISNVVKTNNSFNLRTISSGTIWDDAANPGFGDGLVTQTTLTDGTKSLNLEHNWDASNPGPYKFNKFTGELVINDYSFLRDQGLSLKDIEISDDNTALALPVIDFTPPASGDVIITDGTNQLTLDPNETQSYTYNQDKGELLFHDTSILSGFDLTALTIEDDQGNTLATPSSIQAVSAPHTYNFTSTIPVGTEDKVTLEGAKSGTTLEIAHNWDGEGEYDFNKLTGELKIYDVSFFEKEGFGLTEDIKIDGGPDISFSLANSMNFNNLVDNKITLTNSDNTKTVEILHNAYKDPFDPATEQYKFNILTGELEIYDEDLLQKFSDNEEIKIMETDNVSSEISFTKLDVGTPSTSLGEEEPQPFLLNYQPLVKDNVILKSENGMVSLKHNANTYDPENDFYKFDIVKGELIVSDEKAFKEMMNDYNFNSNDQINFTESQNLQATSHVAPVTVFDDRGGEHELFVQFRKTSEGEEQSTWELAAFIANEGENGYEKVLDNYTITFKGGKIVGEPKIELVKSVDGSEDDLKIKLDVSQLTELSSATTALVLDQNGYTSGDLQDINVDQSGSIIGTYSNGENVVLAQIALATFANPEGLSKNGETMFTETRNSGPALTNKPGEGGNGVIKPETLEMSNVDLSSEFVDMITTQRGFQANSRIITTSDEILQEIVTLRR